MSPRAFRPGTSAAGPQALRPGTPTAGPQALRPGTPTAGPRGRMRSAGLWAALAAVALAAFAAPSCKGMGIGDDDDGEGGGADPDRSCGEPREFFAQKVWKPLLSQQCVGCHTSEGQARNTRLVLTPSDDAAALDANFEVAKALALASEAEGGEPLLTLKPTGRARSGHTGGALLGEGGALFDQLSTFAKLVRGERVSCVNEESCPADAPGPRALRRLSRWEYDRTVSDLFGIASARATSFVDDPLENGFDNNARVTLVSGTLAAQLAAAADEIAEEVGVPAKLAALLPCAAADKSEACAREYLARVGKRAFRRPPTEAEIERYLGLYRTVAADPGGAEGAPADPFFEGVKAMTSALLQSPHFLYRRELGAPDGRGGHDLDAYELASELSYLLTGSLPDDELFAAADEGRLGTPEQLEAQARRLLQTPRARETLAHFVELWLQTQALPQTVKDAAAYPDFGEGVRAAMAQETRDFVTHVLEAGGTFADLFTAEYTVASPALASFYGLPAPGPDGLVSTAGTPYGGLLTQGSVLAAHSKFLEPGLIERGKFVRSRLLCLDTPPPPPSLMIAPPPPDPNLSTRERFARHSTEEPCRSCHRLIDPIGFGFERFDAVGRHHLEENSRPLGADGELVGVDEGGGPFQDVRELEALIASNEQAQRCFALQWSRFAYGLDKTGTATCPIATVQNEFVAGEKTIEGLILSVVRRAHFRSRGEGKVDPPAGGSAGSPTAPPAGSGGAPPTPPPAGSGGAPPAPPTDPIAVAWDVFTEWETGFCVRITVTNKTNQELTWSFQHELKGTIDNAWNVTITQAGDVATFTGQGDRARVGPMASAGDMGFCATK
jgi:uncharacterized protein DUF1592/uncharacterized protein DUF1588/uncharacterized protein DUF1595/uncharacterized protein DUF1587/uncharacterized protein DUF1585/cellulose binding protein with CBM2 domain